MTFQVQGKLYKTFATEQKTDTFRAREFVLEINESQYPQLIKFQLTQDKCELIDNFDIGDIVSVSFDLRGREWNDRFFTNLNAWKIENSDTSQGDTMPTGSGAGMQGSVAPTSNQATHSSSERKTSEMDFDDDIPF